MASLLLRKFTTTAAATFNTTSTLLTTVLRSKAPSTRTTPIFPHLCTRSFATTKNDQEKNPQSDAHSKPPLVITGPPEAFKYEHPFQIQGSKEVVEVDDTKDGTLVRLALPGVGEDGYKVWVEHHTVFFQAKADFDFKTDQPRLYVGSLEFRPQSNQAEGVKAHVTNGILKLLVPYTDGVDLQDVNK